MSVGQRRTPGLRREEVAQLAGVGVSWYTWLEQGRDINASPEVLEAVGRALQLNEAERAHLFVLAGLNPPRVRPVHSTSVSPELSRLIDTWNPRPAILRDRYWNLITFNNATRLVFGYGDTDNNCLTTFFTNARYRDMHTEWEAIAPDVVAAYRADVAYSPADPGFQRIIGQLSSASTEFDELWARHDVAAPTQSMKAVRHPEVGDLVFDKTTMALIDRPDWHLEFYNPRPGTGTAERLDELTRSNTLASA